jgi:transposase
MNTKNVTILKQSFGIDLSKDTFDACLVVLPQQHECKTISHKQFSNTLSGIEQFITWAEKQSDPSKETTFTVEATGVYYETLAYTLYEKGKTVNVVLPNIAKKFAESLGNKSKTDKLDAKSLGQLGAERRLMKWEPASENIKILKNLTRERVKRQEQKTKVRNQLHALKHSYRPCESTITRYNDLSTFLENQIKMIEKEIIEVIKKDKVLEKKVKKITSIPGIGILTVACVVAETNGFAAIKNIKQLQSYAGYDVKIRESGKWKGESRISKNGNSYIRRALYFPALCITKYSMYHKKFHDRIVTRRGKTMVGFTAVQRKLLGLIYTLWVHDSSFDIQYQV